MEDACINPDCSVHAREDVRTEGEIPGTGIATFVAVTYVNQYAVFTQGDWSTVQLLALAVLEAISAQGGEEAAREAAESMPSLEYATMEELFQTNYATNVIEVGYGSLSDVSNGSESWKDGVVKYANATTSAEEAIKLHDELVVMINAGLFNGENL